MIFDEYKKLNIISNKTPNFTTNTTTQLEPKTEESVNRNSVYKKYKSSNIFTTKKSNNSEIRQPEENTLTHVK